MKRFQKVLFCAVILSVLLLGAGVAGASSSIETTPAITTVDTTIKLSAKTIVSVPAGSDLATVQSLLATTSVQMPSLSSFGVAFKNKSFKAPAAYVSRASSTLLAAIKRTVLSTKFAQAVLAAAAEQTEPKTVNLSSVLVKLAVKDARAVSATQKYLVNPIVSQARIAPKSMEYVYNRRTKKMTITSARTGYKATKHQVLSAFVNAYTAACDSGAKAMKSAATPITPAKVTPKIAKKSQLGKCIVVDKSKRRLYVYSKGRRTSVSYRVTIGMSSFATPNGTYKIGAKRYLPSWGNPGSAWAKNMPARIAPGASNPLGLRAMNINTLEGSDTGLRIHGTSNLRQIGTASSHGCVRVYNTNIVKLYPKISSGDRVVIQP